MNGTTVNMDQVPEGPVVLTVGLHIPEIKAQALSHIQHITEVQADDVEEDRGHADFIQSPDILPTTRVIWLPPAELDTKFTGPRRKFHRNNPRKRLLQSNHQH